MAEVTQEVWSVHEITSPAPFPDVDPAHGERPILTICLDLPGAVEGRQNARVLFQAVSGLVGDPNGPGRAAMAARAPTFFRLLAEVVRVVVLPADLEYVIRQNLHRASEAYPAPPPWRKTNRKNVWEKLLDDDVAF